VSVELVFQDALAAVELLNSALNFGIDCVAVLEQPAVLFLLRVERSQ
jgi:hypothetical protein